MWLLWQLWSSVICAGFKYSRETHTSEMFQGRGLLWPVPNAIYIQQREWTSRLIRKGFLGWETHFFFEERHLLILEKNVIVINTYWQ